MDGCYGQVGWNEFYRNRIDILNEYDRIKKITENRPIQVSHGVAAEANLRKWLSEFLPQKYGVTSGYIIPNLYSENYDLRHYDVIVYNKMESPILWTESNSDNSEQGKYRAIPAKYVHAVYEVKSRLNNKNAIDAIKKLRELCDFRDQLVPKFSCGIIFIELLETDNKNTTLLKSINKGIDIPGFIGGMVIRYEKDETATGLITISKKENQENFGETIDFKSNKQPLAKPIEDLAIYTLEDNSVRISEQNAGLILHKTDVNTWSYSKIYTAVYTSNNNVLSLTWSRRGFSDFCKRLLTNLEGLCYEDGNIYSYGCIFDSAKFLEAQKRASVKNESIPNLEVDKIGDIDISKNNYRIINSEEVDLIEVPLLCRNPSEKDLICSYDNFESNFILGSKQYRGFPIHLSVGDLKGYSNINEYIENEILEYNFRIVYSENCDHKEFYYIETKLLIGKNQFQLVAI